MFKKRDKNQKKAGAKITYQHGKTKITGDSDDPEVMKIIAKEQSHTHFIKLIRLAVCIAILVTILMSNSATLMLELLSGSGIVRLVSWRLTGK